ncbi:MULTISPECIES: NACHT domain-containing protein [Stenotrophomonas]|uniref:NACHT domain-containing protein n=1 Tax=Stenotrophomonas TaxID=40323 RepID=UPI0009E98206|nr:MULTISPECIES: NACHT domain-containing protein [Stenotrophomonas]
MQISQSEKEKFIADLDEDGFRELVVRRLFKSLGYKDGRDTCGPEEFGKDAIFVDVDRLGVENFIAVQTKRGNVNLSGDPNNNLHSLVAQVRTALNHPHACTLTKKKALPQVVYVAASGRINQAARTFIAEQVSEPRLRFLDRDDLISKIDESCPEVWSNIVADVSPYLKALADKVEDLSILSDSNPIHSTLGAFAAASDQRFVDVRLGYHSAKVVRRSGSVDRDLNYEEISGTSLLTSGVVRAFLVGDAGSGKTTLLIRLAYLIAKRSVVSSGNYRVPIFVRAHELADVVGQSVYGVLERIVLKIQDIASSPFSVSDLDEGRLVLLVDGLDELSESNDRQNVVDFIRIFMDQYPKCSFVLGSRPYGSISKLEGLDVFKRYRISPLNMQDASKMLNGINGSGVANAEWRKELLRKLDAVHGIDLNPLLVTVFAISSGNEKRDIPANITELFAKFSELMLGRWDEKKGMAQQYQSKVKDHLLSLFAYRLQVVGLNHFSKVEFIDFAREQLISMNLEPDLDVMVSEILDRSGLIRGDDDELEFKHHLLQEYFASKGIPDVSKIKDLVNNEWWRNSIVFYFGAQPSAVSDLLDVATSPLTIPEESYMAIGLALQACYLSKLDERIEVWKWVVEAASGATRKFLDESKDYPVTSFLGAYLEARDSVALGGIEKVGYRVRDWIVNAEGSSELRRFWYVTALIELGEFESIQEIQDSLPFEDEMLATAVHFGCYFSTEVRSIPAGQKVRAAAICKQLDPKVARLRVKIIEELKGQLLEFQRSGVVALDAVDPV